EGALLYGIRGSVALAIISAPVVAAFESLRSRHYPPRHYQVNYVTFQVGVGLLMGLIIGWLVERLRGERAIAGRRVDLLEAATDASVRSRLRSTSTRRSTRSFASSAHSSRSSASRSCSSTATARR